MREHIRSIIHGVCSGDSVGAFFLRGFITTHRIHTSTDTRTERRPSTGTCTPRIRREVWGGGWDRR